MRNLKVLAHRVQNFRKICAFSYSSSFPIKMLATDVKTQKIENGPNFIMTYENFGAQFSKNLLFFVFVILSYQNACNGCENAGNRKWSD